MVVMMRFSQGKAQDSNVSSRGVAAAVFAENASYKKKCSCAGRQDDIVFRAEINRVYELWKGKESIGFKSDTSRLLRCLKERGFVCMYRQMLGFPGEFFCR